MSTHTLTIANVFVKIPVGLFVNMKFIVEIYGRKDI